MKTLEKGTTMARFAILVFLYLLTDITHAEETPLWKTVGGWQIRADTTLGNGCFTYQVFEGDTFVRVGINKLEGGVYIMIGDLDWRSLEAGKEYPIKLYFGDETPWSGDATAVEISGVPTLWLQVAEKDSAATLLREFMHEVSVRIDYKNKSIANLSLKGTYKAGQEVIKCQEAYDEAGGKVDPFGSPGNSSGSADDPFAI